MMDIDDMLNNPRFENLRRYLDDQLFSHTDEDTRAKLIEVFGDYHKARNWYYSKLPALGDKRPYDLCKTGDEKLLYEELINIEHGRLC